MDARAPSEIQESHSYTPRSMASGEEAAGAAAAEAAVGAHVEIEDVHHAFDDRKVFEGLDVAFGRGETSVVLGGSGSGKSTLLRMIGGLERPDRGRIKVGGEEITHLSERELFRVRRRIGMLFQGGALLDSLSVYDNVALPLREERELSEREIAEQVERRLAAVGLPDTSDLLPGQLSGGMRRRAALARAIVTDPEIVLCDEPFSGLDPLNVRRIEALLMRLNRRLGITLIVSSHHIASALRMASQLVFLLEGHAVTGTPAELPNARDPRVRQFFAAEETELEVAAWDGEHP